MWSFLSRLLGLRPAARRRYYALVGVGHDGALHAIESQAAALASTIFVSQSDKARMLVVRPEGTSEFWVVDLGDVHMVGDWVEFSPAQSFPTRDAAVGCAVMMASNLC